MDIFSGFCGLTRVRIEDPCPLGLLHIWIVAQAPSASKELSRLSCSGTFVALKKKSLQDNLHEIVLALMKLHFRFRV